MGITTDKIYTKSVLPYSGHEVTVLEGNGEHYLKAFGGSNGISELMLKSLVLQLVKINNKSLAEDDIKDIHIRDMIWIVEILNSMMTNL